jgi:RHS repeat-associated protein
MSNTPPNTDQNFVREETILTSGITNENQIAGLSITEKGVAYKYYDGMARQIEAVKKMNSPSLQDVVEADYYDVYGRKTRTYLPYTSSLNTGGFRGAYDSEARTFYSGTALVANEGSQSSARPFFETIYEASSLGRTTDKYGPGADWLANARRNREKTRMDASGTIRKWTYVDDNTAPTLSTYPSNADTLLIKETIDEENHAVRKFYDKRGLLILQQVQGSGDYINSPAGVTWAETYYVYDDLGQTRIIISPEGTNRIGTEYVTDDATKKNFLKRWAFWTKYDAKGNPIAKWIPGWNDWHYTVYDKWNRVVFTQTPMQRATNEWLYTKYDSYNRVIMTGVYTNATDQDGLQSLVNTYYTTNPNNRYEVTTNDATGYTLSGTYPNTAVESSLRKITYYDNYYFKSNSGWDAEGPAGSFDFYNIAGFPQNTETFATPNGQETGSKTRVLGAGNTQWLNTVKYYDKKYKVVQVINENFIGGRDINTSKFDFIGKVLKGQLHHTSATGSFDVLREWMYDAAGRVTRLYQTTDNTTRVLLAAYIYNEIGQVVEKNVHSTDDGVSFIQSVDSRYNIRGWLASINNSSLTNDGIVNNDTGDLFGMEIQYNPSTTPTINGFQTKKIYNGGISNIKWKTDTKQGTPQEQIFGFDFDHLYRFKRAAYAKNNGGVWTADVGMFEEAVGSYDLNGNMNSITRTGKVEGVKNDIDALTYTYTLGGQRSNRLIALNDDNGVTGFKDADADTPEEYLYDNSGNLIYDNNKGISSITYNYLNLPEVITLTRQTSPVTQDKIFYTYDAAGNKLRTLVKINNVEVSRVDYADNIQYKNNVLAFAETPEGRVVKNSTGYDYEYFYKDHQSNTRLTYGLMKETVSYKATMENPATSNIAADEQSKFANVNSTRFTAGNYTKPSAEVLVPNKSSQTNGYLNKPIGMAKSLSLANGDKVEMEVFATFNTVPGTNAVIVASALVSALGGTFGTVSGETLYTRFNDYAPGISGIPGASTTVPKAYLAYLFFDQSYNFVTSSAIGITSSAFNAFEKLQRTFTAPQAGYLYVYVGNETNVNNTSSVYFDEMLIVHQKNNASVQVTQASDYYPFGLQFNTYQSERISETFAPVVANRIGFQGQELQTDLDLGWSAFKWRMHDPAIGRFGAVDPLAEKYAHNSTFAFSENKLTSHVELEGKEGRPVITGDYIKGLLWKDAGWSYKPNQTETNEISLKLAKNFTTAYLTVMTMAIPVEELVLVGGLGMLAKSPRMMRLFGYATSTTRPLSGTKALTTTVETITTPMKLETRAVEATKLLETTKITETSFNMIKSGSEITSDGIVNITKHLEKFPDGKVGNDIMVERLHKINKGEMNATEIDINFYNHESREAELMRNNLSYTEAHNLTLQEQGIAPKDAAKALYTPEANEAQDAAWLKEANQGMGTTINIKN